MKLFRVLFFLLFLVMHCLAGDVSKAPFIQRLPKSNAEINQGDIRVFVVLVEFSDVKFKSIDSKSQFTDYLNKKGYNEYHNLGSVRDYFIYNSMGNFRPIFDVYGPVTLPETQGYYDKAGAEKALLQAVDVLLEKDEVDFLQYDNNGDGEIDYVYMIYAGTATVVGKDLWPHRGILSEKNKRSLGENLHIAQYACSNEIDLDAYDRDSTTDALEGIGTLVHEFSHLLGLPDLYLTERSFVSSSWDVMDGGVYNCPPNVDYVRACAPPLYSAFERMLLGWLIPEELKTDGPIRLNKLDDNVAYSITNPNNPNEMYLLEYRTKKGWDIGQDTSGLLIWHIDYVDSMGNAVNNFNSRHVDVVEAQVDLSVSKICNALTGECVYGGSSSYDVFPGKGNVTEFNKFVFLDGLDMNIKLSDITESEDKESVSFNVSRSEPYIMEVSSSSEDSSVFHVFFSSSSTTLRPMSFSFVEISSAEGIRFASKENLNQVSVVSRNGLIYIETPVQSTKSIKVFSINGQLLFETLMDGTENSFEWPSRVGNQNVILFISQKNKNLYRGIVCKE